MIQSTSRCSPSADGWRITVATLTSAEAPFSWLIALKADCRRRDSNSWKSGSQADISAVRAERSPASSRIRRSKAATAPRAGTSTSSGTPRPARASRKRTSGSGPGSSWTTTSGSFWRRAFSSRLVKTLLVPTSAASACGPPPPSGRASRTAWRKDRKSFPTSVMRFLAGSASAAAGRVSTGYILGIHRQRTSFLEVSRKLFADSRYPTPEGRPGASPAATATHLSRTMKNVFTILSAAAVMAAPLSAQIDDFENGANPNGWYWNGFATTTIHATGGNPGGWCGANGIFALAPIVRTGASAGSPFVGDLRAGGVTDVKFDAQYTAGFGGSPMCIMLRDESGTPGNEVDDNYAFYVDPVLTSPMVGTGWNSYSMPIPSADTAALPAGWQGRQRLQRQRRLHARLRLERPDPGRRRLRDLVHRSDLVRHHPVLRRRHRQHRDRRRRRWPRTSRSSVPAARSAQVCSPRT